MGEKRRTAERNTGAFLGPAMGTGGGMVPLPTNSITVGPGDPGPEDAWKIPAGPIEVKANAIPEPASPGRGGSFLHRLIHRG
jgi:hypothetical protein